MLEISNRETTFMTLDDYKYEYKDYYLDNGVYIRIKNNIAYLLSPKVVNQLGGIGVVSSGNLPRRLPLLYTDNFDIHNLSSINQHLLATGVNPTTLIKIIIGNLNNPYLVDMGILTVKPSDKGFYYSVLKKLEGIMPRYKLYYMPRNPIDKSIISTKQSLTDVVFNGYKGNRLDVMVGNYQICDIDNLPLAWKIGSKIEIYENCILTAFSRVLHKEIISIYTIKE
jgi:hypothetical protein